MAVGPVQLIVLGFDHPDFHGEIIEELERLRESDTVRVIDALAVHKDADGEIEVVHLSNLTRDEAIELGSKIGALIGLGIEGEEGVEAGALAGAEAGAKTARRVLRRRGVGRPRGHPERLRGRADPARAPLGGRRCATRSLAPVGSGSATGSSARSTWSRSACCPPRKPRNCTRWTAARR